MLSVSDYKIYNELTLDEHVGVLNRFWLGFIIYSLSYTISTADTISAITCQAIQCVGLLLLIPSAAKLIDFKIENSYLRSVYKLYCFWLIITIFRGFTLQYDFLKAMLFNAWFGIFVYFVPLVLLFPQRVIFYKRIFDVIFILGIACIIYDGIFIRVLLSTDILNLKSQGIVENFSKTLGIPCGFLLLTYMYQSKKKIFIAFAVMGLTFILAVFRARRGLMFIALSPLLLFYLVYNYANKARQLRLILSIILLGVVTAFGFNIYNKNRGGFFNSITERIDADTRSGVEHLFYTDMNDQDWLFGRGVNGQYYCPGIDDDFGSVYRDTIETDYLQIILKGGIISLALLLLIALPALFKGLFQSKNMLSKAASLWILLWLIDLYPANVTTFTLNYILVWVSIGICYSDVIRNIPESEMAAYFQTSSE